MVHALKEIWRVLILSGYLIDLRPYTHQRPIELVTPNEVFPIGFIDSSAGIPDDVAANSAIEHAVTTGLFAREQSTTFEYCTYWDSVDELRAYIHRSKKSTILPETLAKAETLASYSQSNAQLRSRRDIIITRYQKS